MYHSTNDDIEEVKRHWGPLFHDLPKVPSGDQVYHKQDSSCQSHHAGFNAKLTQFIGQATFLFRVHDNIGLSLVFSSFFAQWFANDLEGWCDTILSHEANTKSWWQAMLKVRSGGKELDSLHVKAWTASIGSFFCASHASGPPPSYKNIIHELICAWPAPCLWGIPMHVCKWDRQLRVVARQSCLVGLNCWSSSLVELVPRTLWRFKFWHN